MKNIYQTIFLLILNSAFSIHNSFSQTAPGIEWARCYGGTNYDGSTKIEPTSEGGYIIIGSTSSNDGDVNGNHGGNDFWLIKLDNSGIIEWQKCIGGSSSEFGWSVQPIQDIGYAIAGSSFSNDGDISGNHGDLDVWGGLVDSLGNLQWQNSFGGTQLDYGYSIQQTQDGGFKISGDSESNDSNVNGNHGDFDYWIMKTDSGGILQWQKCLGGSYNDESRSSQITQDGGYIISGTSFSNNGDVSGNHGNSDGWLVKLDSLGNLQWQKCFGGTDNEWIWTIQQTQDGGFIGAGYTNSNNGDVSGNHGGYDFWIIKLDSSGVLQWQKCLGGTDNEYALFIRATSDGGYITCGYTLSNNGDVSGNHGGEDFWVVKIDSVGNLQWQKCLGGSANEEAYSIFQMQDSSYIVTGYTISNDGNVSGNHGLSDVWIVKLFPDTITGITNFQLPTSNFHFSPNPLTTQSKLNFKNPDKEKFLFTLYDITGRVTESVSTTNNEIILTKGSKPTGVYLFNLMNEKTGERWNGKIIIAN